MNEKPPIDHQTVYDDLYEGGYGEIPDKGTPVEVSLDIRINSHSQMQDSVDNGELGEIARTHTDKNRAVGFRFTGPRKVSMFVANHPDSILKATVVGAIGIAATTAIILYEHRKGKKE